MFKRTRSLIANLVLVIASFTLALLGAEFAVRTWSPHETSIPWEDDLDGVICPRPNVHGRYAIPNTFDVRLNINSQRFRSRKEFTPVPAPGILRIAALGDSFTHGVGANDDEAYPARLQQELSARLGNASAGQVEVLNGGASSTGSSDQSLFFHLWVARFKPQVVLLNVFVNDVDEDLSRGLFVLGPDGQATPRSLESLRAADQRVQRVRTIVNMVPGYSLLSQHMQLLGYLRTNGTIALNAFRFKAFAASKPATPPRDPLAVFRKDGLPLLAGEIQWLHKRAEAAGSRLVVVYIPPREVIYPNQFKYDPANWREKSPAITTTIAQMAGRESIPFIDLTAPTLERAASSSVPLYYTGDFHATPAGYLCFAQAVAQFLVEHVLPPGLWPPNQIGQPLPASTAGLQ